MQLIQISTVPKTKIEQLDVRIIATHLISTFVFMKIQVFTIIHISPRVESFPSCMAGN